MLELRVWAECRPIHERDTHSHQLIQELEAIEARENEQENARLALVKFVTSIRQALAALTHF